MYVKYMCTCTTDVPQQKEKYTFSKFLNTCGGDCVHVCVVLKINTLARYIFIVHTLINHSTLFWYMYYF
jgi:hypothetical protein